MIPAVINPQTMYEWFQDFLTADAPNDITSTDDGATGTNTLNGAAGGTYSVVTAAADNDYHLMSSKAKSIALVASKPAWFEARIQCTEANTNAANWIVGLSDTLTTGNLANDGAGPATTQDAIAFFKVDGTMYIQFLTSNGTAQTINSTLVAFTSGVWYRVGFHFDPNDGTTALITPFVYNETTGVRTVGSVHRLTLASMGPCYAIFGAKAGSSSAETLIVDYVRAVAKR